MSYVLHGALRLATPAVGDRMLGPEVGSLKEYRKNYKKECDTNFTGISQELNNRKN
jgi:hypothetical protein